MTTLTSQTPAVIDYLVTAATASTSLGAAQPVPVIVLDGPEATADTLAEPLHLWIGHDPKNETEATASADQDFAFMDYARTRDERGEITCAADAWGGSATLKIYRDQCAGIAGAVELLLRGTAGTGGPGDASMGGLALWSQVVGPFTWYPRQTPDGAGMLCVFKIAYYARLTTS
jgi:hypothetical protein